MVPMKVAILAAFLFYRYKYQSEDIISFLVDTHSVIKIELDGYDKTIAPIVDVYPIEKWKQGLSKTFQIKIAVAIDLAKNDSI